MLKEILCLDKDGDIVLKIPIPEGATVSLLDDKDVKIDIQNSSEKDPLGVVIDVYDKDNEIVTEASFLYE